MTDWASRDAVNVALERWSDEQVACRAYAHTWRPFSVQHRPGVYIITQRCSRCRNRRRQEINEQGYPLGPWRTTYQRGYLLEGVGRLGVDGRAALRLATLRGATIVEVEDE
jgi:hypothetical protein